MKINLNDSVVLLTCISFLLVLFGCTARPTSAPPGTASPIAPIGSTESAPLPPPSTPTGESLQVPIAPTAISSLTPTSGAPAGSIVIAGVRSDSTAITALPEFISSGLFDSLLAVDAQDGSLAPSLAETWAVSDDAKTITFTLRSDVRWHDGARLTADDVVFTLKGLSDPAVRMTPTADFGPIDQITTLDSKTVKVTFKESYCAALSYIGGVKILPKRRLETKSLANIAPADLIGTGPLVLQNWNDETITLRANPNYWAGAPGIANWTYKMFPDASAANDAVRQGKADVIASNVTLEGVSHPVTPANEFYAVALNTTRKPFDDARVRQAVAAALDRARLRQDMQENPSALDTSMLPMFWAYPSNLAAPEFDLTRARQLLSEAGWRDAGGDGILDKDGAPFEVTLWAQVDDPRSELVAQLVRAQLEKIGVRAVLKLPDRTLFLTRLFLQEYDLAVAHLNIPLDPDQHYFWASSEDKPGFGLNVTGYQNTQVERALQAGNRTPHCEPLARKGVYATIFQQIAADVPMVFLFAPPRVVNAQPRVQGIAPSSFAGAFWNLNRWQVEQE